MQCFCRPPHADEGPCHVSRSGFCESGMARHCGTAILRRNRVSNGRVARRLHHRLSWYSARILRPCDACKLAIPCRLHVATATCMLIAHWYQDCLNRCKQISRIKFYPGMQALAAAALNTRATVAAGCAGSTRGPGSAPQVPSQVSARGSPRTCSAEAGTRRVRKHDCRI